MTVRAEIHEGKIYLDAQYSDKEMCKNLPGSKWDKDRRQWYMRVTWSSCKQLRASFGDRLEIGPELLKWATDEYEGRIRYCLQLRDALDTPGDQIPLAME